MLPFLRRQWFLISLSAIIAAGLALGLLGFSPVVKPWADRLPPQVTTALVLFLMAFSLETRALGAAVRAPGPVALSCALNTVVLPLLAWGLMPLQTSDDFRYGLMIAASVPSTLASASVMTRKALGNDAVSLLTTLLTNGACFAITPACLYLTTARDVDLNVWDMVETLLLAVLLPTLIGQILRQVPVLRDVAIRRKLAIGVVAQILIEVVVFTAALRAGAELFSAQARGRELVAGGLLISAGCGVLLHLVVWKTGLELARRLGMGEANAAAVSFAGSQKTMPVGLVVATDPATFGEAFPFALFPMLLYHIGQLFLDTVLAARLAAKASARQK